MTATEIEDVVQDLRLSLFVGNATSEPRIRSYRGRGPLASWLRVTAIRAALKVRDKRHHDVGVEDGELEAKATGDNPELAALKVSCRAELTASFQEALDALDHRTRTVLRLSVLDNLSVDEIGGLYRVHRATAARWVVAAQEELLRGTRRNLMRRARIRPEECDSMLRLVRSQLAETIRRRLVDAAPLERGPDVKPKAGAGASSCAAQPGR